MAPSCATALPPWCRKHRRVTCIVELTLWRLKVRGVFLLMKKGNSAVLQAPVNFFSLLTYITLVTTAVFVKPMDILVRIQEKSQVGTGLGVYHHCLK